MGDAGVDVVKLPNSVLPGEVAAFLLVDGVFLGFRRRNVVQDDREVLSLPFSP
jgi:hypothetical protein